MFFMRFGHGSRPPFGSGFGAGLLLNGILCVGFGMAILIEPDLLAHIVATFLLIVGISMILGWWKLRR